MQPAPCATRDAEQAAAYIVSAVAARAGSRLSQGLWPRPLTSATLAEPLDLVARTRLRGVTLPVAQALVAWGEGRRRVRLLERVPLAGEVLALQADGERCVSLLADDRAAAPHADGLAFVLHDLCHLEKFVDPEHHAGQVGFFRVVHAAMVRPAWGPFAARFDVDFARDLEHVVADMNGSAVFLFAALKMKLKMASRRRVARLLGRPPACGGELDADERGAFQDDLEAMFDLLALDGAARDAARIVSTRRDHREAASALLGYFEAVGAAPRWRAVS